MLFPAEAEALGPLSRNIATDVWWSPFHPYKSTLDGTTAQKLADDFAADTGKQWTQALGLDLHAVRDRRAGVQVGERPQGPQGGRAAAQDHEDRRDERAAGLRGRSGPRRRACRRSSAASGGEGKKFPWEMFIVDNSTDPSVAGQRRPAADQRGRTRRVRTRGRSAAHPDRGQQALRPRPRRRPARPAGRRRGRGRHRRPQRGRQVHPVRPRRRRPAPGRGRGAAGRPAGHRPVRRRPLPAGRRPHLPGAAAVRAHDGLRERAGGGPAGRPDAGRGGRRPGGRGAGRDRAASSWPTCPPAGSRCCSASAWRSPGRWAPARACCCWTRWPVGSPTPRSTS